MVQVKWKRRLTHITIGFFFLLGGIEYAVILPTVWLYLQNTFNAEPYMLGLVLSAFSVSGLLAGPLLGRWSDKTGNTKLVILVANLFEIAGNIMYFIGLSDWFLVASRLVAGIGAGAGSAIFADIARVTSLAERTGTMSLFMAVRQAGLIAGPGLNLFLRELHFDIGPFPVNTYSAPGLFMALMWIVLEVMVLFMYWNLPTLYQSEKEEVIRNSMQYSTSNGSLDLCNPVDGTNSSNYHQRAINADIGAGPPSVNNSQEVTREVSREVPRYHPGGAARQVSWFIGTPGSGGQNAVASSSDNIVTAENYMSGSPGYLQYGDAFANTETSSGDDAGTSSECLVPNEASENQATSSSSEATSSEAVGDTRVDTSTRPVSTPVQIKLTWRFIYTEYVREEVVVILSVVFAAFFNQMVLETMVTPLTRKLLNWGELGNSILYCGAGLQVVFVFIAIKVLSKRISDRWLLLFGGFILLATDGFLIWFIPRAPDGNLDENLWGLMLGTVLDLIAIPCLSVVGTSLYSKITRPETQGFSQGLRRSVGFTAMILGPLWAGGMLQKFRIMLGVCLALNLIVVVMFLLSFKHLKDRPKKGPRDVEAENERRPLLS